MSDTAATDIAVGPAAPIPIPARARLGWVLFAPGLETVNVLLLYFIMAPYITTVVIGDPVEGQALWGWVSAIGALLVAVAGQWLGVVTDIVGGQKRFIAGLTALAAVSAAALWFALPGADMAMRAFIIAAVLGVIIGTETAVVLYNALLPRLATGATVGRLSGTAIATGITWGLALLGAYIVLFLLPAEPFLDLDKAAHEPDRISGPIAGAALVLFALPLLVLTPAMPLRRVCVPLKRLTLGLAAETARALRAHPRLARFVIARMIYQDGIGVALAFGSIYAAGHFGWDGLALAMFGMIVLGASALGALIGGRIDDRIGARRTIVLGLSLLLATLLALIAIPAPEASEGFLGSWQERSFLALACFLGLAIGPAQGSGRSLMARLAPAGEAGRWYGIMALTGNAIAFTGPLLVAIATDAFESQRAGLMVAPVLVAIGLAILIRVAPDDPAASA